MHDLFTSLPLNVLTPGITMLIIATVLLAIFALILKGFALWYSARAGQTKWFIALLIINTMGILEIIYLVWFRPKTTDVMESVIVPLPKDSEPVQS